MEFKITSLDDIVEHCVDNRGKTCPTTEKENEYLPLIATNCINDERLYPELLKTRSIDEETYLNWFRSHPEPGDIIFVNKGTPGKTAFVPEKVNFCIAQDMVALRVKSEYYNRYIYAVLNDPKVRDQIDNMQVGTLIPHFKKTDFKNLKLKIITNISKQKKIGDFYFNICKKIELNYNTIEKLQQVSQTLFKHWFIDFEFPNEEGNPYKSSGGEMVESELGEIPEGWVSSNISEVCLLNKGSYSKKDGWSFINYLDTSSITNNSITNIQLIDVEKEKVPSRAKRKILPNDIVYSTVRPNQYHYGLIKDPLPNMLASTGFTVIRSNSEYPNDLIYMWLTQKEMTKHLQSVAEQSTSAYPSVKADDIGKLKILIPSKNLIKKLNDIICKNHNQIWNYQQENKKLSELRDTLLPKLLSGEIEILDNLEV